MADSTSYTELKNSLSSVSLKALNISSRLILSNNLNVKAVLPSKSGHARDYRGLAELMNFLYTDIKIFERNEDPTMKILEAWETRADATIDKLIGFLEEMERYDVIKELIPLLERNANAYLESQKLQEIPIQDPEVTSCPMSVHPERDLQVYTRDDLRTGECTYYHAYVAYADEDCHFVHRLAKYLESPEVGFKLFIRGRDLLAGYAEHDTNIMLIKERCKRMLIILSPNFLKSPACEFQASFAAGLAIDQKQRMLIPIVLSPCETPLILKYVSKIDFTKPDIQDWVWEKLISSLLPEVNTSVFISSGDRSSVQRNIPPKHGSLATANVNPMITFPPTTKHLPCSMEDSLISVSTITSVDTISDDAVKNSITVPAKTPNAPKRWKLPWNLKGRSSSTHSSNLSVSSSSGATSGFHSQFGTTSENFENSMEDCSSDTPV